MFPVSKYDGKGGPAGEWFRRKFRTAIGLTRQFHELRNTAITGLREAGVQETIINELVGHEFGDSTSFSTYAGASSLAKLKDAINKLPINPGRKG